MKFPSGSIREIEEKPMPLKNLSFLALNELNNYLAKFNHKYEPGNWKLGQDVETYLNAALRHLIKEVANKHEGASIEPEEDHLVAAFFNLMGAVHEREKTKSAGARPCRCGRVIEYTEEDHLAGDVKEEKRKANEKRNKMGRKWRPFLA